MPYQHHSTVTAVVLLTACSGCGGVRDAGKADRSAASASSPADANRSADEDGFRRLQLSDFESFAAEEDTWREAGDTIICTGEPRGYLHTREAFEDFTLRCSYRFVHADDATEERLAASNTGFMIHIQEPHTVWPRSLEVQGKWSEMASIKSNGGAPELSIEDDSAARASARRPVGEWNDIEIVSRDGALTSFVNGTRICESEPGPLTAGMLGLQSEGFEVHFRALRIRD